MSKLARLRNDGKTEFGFSLLELLVVMVILGVLLGAVSLNAFPSTKKLLLNDAQKLSVLMQLAREEAIVRNRPVALELDSEQFRFYVRGQSNWERLTDSDMFRERNFQQSPLIISMQPRTKDNLLPMKIVFGREPVDKPFILTLSYDDSSVSIHADGLGHFNVE